MDFMASCSSPSQFVVQSLSSLKSTGIIDILMPHGIMLLSRMDRDDPLPNGPEEMKRGIKRQLIDVEWDIRPLLFGKISSYRHGVGFDIYFPKSCMRWGAASSVGRVNSRAALWRLYRVY
ncbi:predicted protein [Botrytis cinerea T4]|uniref:Uncharacterized protein n=1 Tax=Botryotinia fuckeliana (strain T4) TaxID=999810 RepID=G2YBF3_BOTF4|nr:predicted protein [Botrytis cinerea T4]